MQQQYNRFSQYSSVKPQFVQRYQQQQRRPSYYSQGLQYKNAKFQQAVQNGKYSSQSPEEQLFYKQLYQMGYRVQSDYRDDDD